MLFPYLFVWWFGVLNHICVTCLTNLDCQYWPLLFSSQFWGFTDCNSRNWIFRVLNVCWSVFWCLNYGVSIKFLILSLFIFGKRWSCLSFSHCEITCIMLFQSHFNKLVVRVSFTESKNVQNYWTRYAKYNQDYIIRTEIDLPSNSRDHLS